MLQLVSLNIEGDNHYDRIFPFFEKEQPDVICLQEFFLEDVPFFEQQLSMKGVASALWDRRKANPYRQSLRGQQGIAIFTKLPILSTEQLYYVGSKEDIPDAMDVGADGVNRSLLVAKVSIEDTEFIIGTTHFTWSDKGETSEVQRVDVQALLKVSHQYPELTLCGDFNAPRGKEIFSTLAARYKDNIPPNVQTTMDNNLHRVPTLKPLVVDGLFTTPQYVAHDVRVVGGVSDHKAIVATISQR